MIRYILKRLILLIPILLGVVVIVFAISYITPGDPIIIILGESYTPELYEAKAVELGLDRSFIVQFFDYLWGLVTRFDFGKSYITGKSISAELLSRFPVSAQLGLAGVAVMILIGIPLGIFSAIKQYSALDFGLTTLAVIIAAIPGFVLALLSLLLFAVQLRWFPLIGLGSPKAYVLPVLTNAFPGIAFLMRMTRTTMLEVIRQDYIGTARSKGLRERVIILKHALGNALIPLITVIGGFVGGTVAGSIIVETIFSIRGMGSFLYSGVNGRDYPVVMGGVLMISFLVCIVNLIVDIMYAFIDPRIKSQYASRGKKVRRVTDIKSKAESEVA